MGKSKQQVIPVILSSTMLLSKSQVRARGFPARVSVSILGAVVPTRFRVEGFRPDKLYAPLVSIKPSAKATCDSSFSPSTARNTRATWSRVKAYKGLVIIGFGSRVHRALWFSAVLHLATPPHSVRRIFDYFGTVLKSLQVHGDPPKQLLARTAEGQCQAQEPKTPKP